MILKIELTPEQEAQLEREARARGLAPNMYVLGKIFDETDSGTVGGASRSQEGLYESMRTAWEKSFADHVAWIAAIADPGAPGILPSELSREKIYEGRGEVHD